MNNKKVFLNSISSITYQIAAVLGGIIIPRFVLLRYGSDANGAVNSIDQFLKIVSFLELGVGAVVQSSLYNPLVKDDKYLVSGIMVSARRFFRNIAKWLVLYVVILMIIYPTFLVKQFEVSYLESLVFVMSLSYFMQYFWGMTDGLLLRADQRGYVVFGIQTITILLNTVVSINLISMGYSIQYVKLATAMIYTLRPLVLRIYVCRNYEIDWHIKCTKEPIAQKWNGIAQHIASFVLDGTDVIVLTILTTVKEVSVYSVYNMILFGIKQLFISSMAGIQAQIGHLWAKNDKVALGETFNTMEWIVHTMVVFVFGCVAVTIIPFIKVYTYGINDVNYILPIFSLIITLANALHCMRLPYNIMILAAGHYKQTQHCYILAAMSNIIISCFLAYKIGIVGVAIGTLIAMTYQTLWMMVYVSKYLLVRPTKESIVHLLLDIIVLLLSFGLTARIEMTTISYFSWGLYAAKVAGVLFFIDFVVNYLLYKYMFKTCRNNRT